MSEQDEYTEFTKAGTKRLNKFTRELKDAMLAGAENSIHAKDPNDPNAPGTVTQFMTNVANKYPDKYAQMLTKFIPQQYHMQRTEIRAEVTYQSVNDIKRALEEEGFTLKQIEALEAMLPTASNAIEVEGESKPAGNSHE
jgi:16S rRNA C967 or C1407 C5-methylase (RsmB/RsmF family)